MPRPSHRRNHPLFWTKDKVGARQVYQIENVLTSLQNVVKSTVNVFEMQNYQMYDMYLVGDFPPLPRQSPYYINNALNYILPILTTIPKTVHDKT
jgi:hypothetical protein